MPRDFAPPPPSENDIERICMQVLVHSPNSITTLRSGAWSRAIGIETNDGPMVLRFSQSGDDFRADQLSSQYASPHLPIPEVFGVGQLEERWWCLSQRMPGVHLDELDAGELERVIPSLAAMLRAMRSVSSNHTTGYGGWDSDGNGMFPTFAEQLLDVAVDNGPESRGGGWSSCLRPHTRAQAIFDAGMVALQDFSRFLPAVRNLIHQDTINFNVTVADGAISGVFDWGCAMWGDALYDLAWFRFWNPWYPQWSELNLPQRLVEHVGIEGDHGVQRMHCYLLHIGLMHIRYCALIEDWKTMNQIAAITEKLVKEPPV